jgi:hypothetical protein
VPQSTSKPLQDNPQPIADRLPTQSFLPQAYQLTKDIGKGLSVTDGPRVVFIEATNHCNLHCQTCPRTYFQREPLRSLT